MLGRKDFTNEEIESGMAAVREQPKSYLALEQSVRDVKSSPRPRDAWADHERAFFDTAPLRVTGEEIAVLSDEGIAKTTVSHNGRYRSVPRSANAPVMPREVSRR